MAVRQEIKSSLALARFFEPMLCLSVERLPEGPEWHYQLKLDGYRAIGAKTAGRVQLWSRNGRDFRAGFPTIAKALDELPDETLIDEIVALDENGKPSFNLLQNHNGADRTLVFYAFDLLIHEGQDLRARPLEERCACLRELLGTLHGPIRLCESFNVTAEEILTAARLHGFEGVVAKKRASSYQPGKRSGDWVKLRINRGQELVIGGYVPDGKNLESILVGYYEGRHLIYAARIRSGFVPALRREIFEAFQGLDANVCPFANLPDTSRGRWGEGLTAEKMAHCRWLKPRLVAQIEFLEWTPDNRLRHPRKAGRFQCRKSAELL